MPEPLPWRLRLLELFGDSMVDMLFAGYIFRGYRRETVLGTLAWLACVIAGSMMIRATYDYARRDARAAHRAALAARRETGVPQKSIPWFVRAVFYGATCLFVVLVSGALFWLVRPFLP